MGLFGLGKSKEKEKAAERVAQDDSTCSHPVAYQVQLRDDPQDPKKVTGFKCTQCGDRITFPESVTGA